MAKVLDPRETAKPWGDLGKVAEALLTTAERDAGRDAVTNSFYTPEPIMDAAWRIILGYGTPAGPVLEPGCGSGRFMSLAPDGFTVHGVEADPTSARIARLLHPDHVVHEGLFQHQALTGQFVAAVGNVPYGNEAVRDRRVEARLNLHNYFLWRSVQAVLPGGLVVALTSKFTIDAETRTGREAIAEYADLLDVIRLPRSGMRLAGTDVVADLVVLRRRWDDEIANEADDAKARRLRWVHDLRRASDVVDRAPYGDRIHAMLVDRPSRVLGTFVLESSPHGPQIGVKPPDDLADRLDRAVADVYRTLDGLTPPPAPLAPVESLAYDGALAEGTFGWAADEAGGTLTQIVNGKPVPVVGSGKGVAELRQLVSLRDMVLDLIEADADPSRSDDEIAGLRRITLAMYRAYVAKWGPLNRCKIREGKPDKEGFPTTIRIRERMGGFRADPHFVSVIAIEEYDDDTGEARPAPILLGRVNKAPDPVSKVDTPAEAVLVSLDRTGRIDLPLVAMLLDVDEVTATGMLADVAYLDPSTSDWVAADEYLSGDVRLKLRAAERAARADGRFEPNVTALTKALPPDLLPEDIKVRLGAPWVPVTDVRQFIIEHLGLDPSNPRVEIEHQPEIAAWQVVVDSWRRREAVAQSIHGTGRADAYQLIELALNSVVPTVYDTITVDGKKKQVRNDTETMLATEKQRELIDAFTDWVWTDSARRERLARLYNDRYNAVVARTYSGEGLTFPGLASWVTPWDHQRQMVHRMLSMPSTGCGFAVGAGKSLIMIMAALKMRSLGQARKPMVAVPNHLVEQIARESKMMAPTARVLMATEQDLGKEGRKLFAAKVATGDWDLVVIPHSAFTAIPVSGAAEAEYLDEQVRSLEQVLLAGDGQTTGTAGDGGVGGQRTYKTVAKMLKSTKARLADLLHHRVDDGVRWEQLGVDYLMVDEAHYFKNLGFPTSMNGLSLSASKRASDLDMKLWVMRRQGLPRVCTLLTGTMVSNTLAELYVMERYLMPERLQHLGLAHFDAWAAMHIESETKIEVAPDGGSFRVHTRPSRFCNVPEMMAEYSRVVDARSKRVLGLKGPRVVYDTVVIEPTPAMRSFVDGLVERARLLRETSVDPKKDNMLMVCTDGRKAALDLELVGVEDPDDLDDGKVGPVARNILARYRAHQDRVYEDRHGEPSPRPGCLQVAFCDLGTPNAESNQVYGKIRQRLIAGGIPADAIRFVHSAKTNSAKAALFADCRSGKVAVLLGSTDKLGVGTNVQARLRAIHHIDAPWRPADVEQREGRGDRPGNQNDELEVIRYVRKQSFDAYMWQTLERKAKFIEQMFDGEFEGREVAELGDTTLTFTEVKAAATGNPLVMAHAEAVAEVSRLTFLARGHNRNQQALASRVEAATREATSLEDHGQAMAALAMERTNAGWLVDGAPVADEDLTAMVASKVRHAVVQARREHRAINAVAAYRGLAIVAETISTARVYRYEGQEVREVHDAIVFWAATPKGEKRIRLCEPKAYWLDRPDQLWRFADAITTKVTSMEADADRLLLRATAARGEADKARVGLGVPFPQQADLDEAISRKRRVETEMAEMADA